jgi:hypothetical protein
VALERPPGQFLQFREDFLHAPVGHQEFKPRAVALLAVAEVAKDDRRIVDRGQDVLGRQKNRKRPGEVGRAGKTAADLDAVTGFEPAVLHPFQAEHADAVDVGLGAMNPAAAK